MQGKQVRARKEDSQGVGAMWALHKPCWLWHPLRAAPWPQRGGGGEPGFLLQQQEFHGSLVLSRGEGEQALGFDSWVVVP